MTAHTEHTWASRATVVVAAGLAVLQVFWAGGLGDEGTVVGTAVLGVLTLLAATALARLNVFEARLAVALTACAQLGLMLLALIWGLPGHDRHQLDRQSVLALAISLGVLGLLAIDGRLRARSPDPDPLPPYAL